MQAERMYELGWRIESMLIETNQVVKQRVVESV